MPLKRIKIPLPVQGVSQQPDEIRTPSQVAAQEEGWSSVVEGLVKRQPSQYLGKIADFRYRNAMAHPIERDAREEYLAVMGHQSIVVVDTLGTKPPIVDFTHGLIDKDLKESSSDWVKGDGGLTFQHDAGEDPNGVQRAARVGGVETAGSFIFKLITDTLISTSGSYFMRCRFRNDDSTNNIVMRVTYAPSNQISELIVDLSTKAIVSSSQVQRVAVVDLGNGWSEMRIAVGLTSALIVTDYTVAIYVDVVTPGGLASGGHAFIFKPELIQVGIGAPAAFGYLDLEDPDGQVNDPHAFQVVSGWTLGADTEVAQLSTLVGPHGYGFWSRLRTQANGSGNKAAYSQDESGTGTINAFFDGPQVLSTYFKRDNDVGVINLLQATESFSTPSWTHFGNLTITPNATPGPFTGLSRGTLLDDNVVGGTIPSIFKDISTPDLSEGWYTLSVYAKAAPTGDRVILWMRSQGGVNRQQVGFTFSTEVLDFQNSGGVPELGTASVDLGGGWFRITNTFYFDPADAVLLRAEFASFDGADGDVYLWGAQLEKGTVATAYEAVRGSNEVASSVNIGFIDDTPLASYLGTFDFTAKVLSLGEVAGQFLNFGVVDLGGDAYQAFVVFDPSLTPGTAPGEPRGITIIVNDTDAVVEKTVLAWGVDLLDSFREPRIFVEPRKQINATSISDTTYVVNSNKIPDMGSELSGNSTDDTEAFVFVRQGSFNAFYRINIQHNDGEYDSAELLTTTGTGSSAGIGSDAPIETHSLEITTLGNVGTTFSPVINLIATSVLIVTGGDTLDTIADRLFVAVRDVISTNSMQLTVTQFGHIIRISHRLANQNYPVSATSVGGAIVAINVFDDGTPGDRFGTLSTDAIASELASQLSAFTNLTAKSVGSVVQILTEAGKKIERLEVEDGNGDQNMVRMWKEVPFLDELPLECRDGFRLKVVGNTEREADDFYIVFSGDKAGEIGAGVWRESLAGNIPFRFDEATMPHSLTRQQDDDVGTITGVKLSIFFEWSFVDWQDRLVGDPNSNPRPSFIGQPIRNVFLWKNRIGFLAGQNIVLTEAGQFVQLNLWRTTVRNLIDSDLIDIAAGNTRVSKLNHVVAYEEDLLVMSGRTIYILQGSPLTPRTAALAPTLEYRSSRLAQPQAIGRTVMIASDNGEFSELRELSRVTDTAFDAQDITKVVSKYLEGRITSISVSSDRNMLAVTTNGRFLYVYKFFWDGNQKVQSSWSRWSFGEGEVLAAEFLSEKLFILVEREAGLFLERMVVGDGLTDIGFDYVVRLDQRLEDLSGHLATSFVTNTEIVTPYRLESKRYDVVSSAGALLGEAGVGFRNKLNYTENLGQDESEGYWLTVFAGTITSNTGEVLDPLGTNRATKVEDTDAAGQFRPEATIPIVDLIAGKSYSFALYVKRGGLNGPVSLVGLRHVGGSTHQEVLVDFSQRDKVSANLGFDNGTFTSSDAGNGWIRVVVSLPWDGVNPMLVHFRPAQPDNSTQGFTYCAFPQFEEGSKATEYEPMRGNQDVGSTVIKIPGNHTSTRFFVGAAYRFQAELSKPIVRVQSPQGGLDFVTEGRIQARRVLVTYTDTSRLVGVVDKPGRVQSRDILDTAGVLQDGNLSVAVMGEGRKATVTIENDSHLPSAITGAEWFVQHRPKGARA